MNDGLCMKLRHRRGCDLSKKVFTSFRRNSGLSGSVSEKSLAEGQLRTHHRAVLLQFIVVLGQEVLWRSRHQTALRLLEP